MQTSWNKLHQIRLQHDDTSKANFTSGVLRRLQKTMPVLTLLFFLSAISFVPFITVPIGKGVKVPELGLLLLLRLLPADSEWLASICDR